jgi:hypothetical protein
MLMKKGDVGWAFACLCMFVRMSMAAPVVGFSCLILSMINVVGPITRQWALEKGRVGDLCRFGLATYLESLDYWAGAEDGDRKALEIVFEYVDGTSATVSGLFIHECSKLRPKGTDNPYIEYLLSPNERVWYRYRVKNPNPEKEVFNITFRKTDPACILKIGNAVHYRSKITTL